MVFEGGQAVNHKFLSFTSKTYLGNRNGRAMAKAMSAAQAITPGMFQWGKNTGTLLRVFYTSGCHRKSHFNAIKMQLMQ